MKKCMNKKDRTVEENKKLGKSVIRIGITASIICMGMMATACSKKEVDPDPAIPASASIQTISGEEENNGSAEAVDFSQITINTMTIAFYDGYNISTAEAINYDEKIMSMYEFELTQEQIDEVQATLSGISEYVEDPMYEYLNCRVGISDEYRVCINGDMIFYCDIKDYMFSRDPFIVYTAPEFDEVVNQLAVEYMQESVFIKPFEAGIDSIIHNGDNIAVTDDIVEELSKYTFSKINVDTPYDEYGTITDTIVLSDGNVLLLYDKDVRGYLDGTDYGYYVYIGGGNYYSMIEYLEMAQ